MSKAAVRIGRSGARLALMLFVLVVTPASGAAQGGPPGSQRSQRGDPVRDRRLGDEQQSVMEQRFQQRLNLIVRDRLQLNGEQFERLRGIASRTEQLRRTLRREEVATRMALRREMSVGERANEERVGELLDRIPQLERRKLDVMESEQRELSVILSPLQRARYFALQDELRRGMQELQRRRLERDPAKGSPPPVRRLRPQGTPPY